METIRFTIDTNLEIWEFIDKTVDHILIRSFQAHNILEWWESTVKLSPTNTLKNVKVRNMQFDIQTNISGLRQILEQESNSLDIYQFNKAISDTLVIEALPDNDAERILIQNGLQHIISVNFESITVLSIRPDFIKGIAENSTFATRIQYNSTIDRV
ncbi:MAG: hypothetical protein K0S23_120 [Fluviicola sp.]|jgi:hypothetical protein|uniref:hypothetical protein n=1 Tax=Fluviicola sp. TaxID=1917219 RepID=UPI0026327184|nr:hypothetical protein [Fluviicola sp.]MDF3025813.1 hypothetical protein [Fluviicola sp.]